MRSAALLLGALLYSYACVSSACPAQQPAANGTPALTSSQLPQPSLRISVNRVQIPVLVLSPMRDKIYTPIPSNRFSLRFDEGPWFPATAARLEADDPIDLAIVLDGRSPEADLLPAIDRIIANLAPKLLLPHDHVTIYALACGRARGFASLSTEPGQLKTAVDNALSDWTDLHQKKGISTSCNSTGAPLWDLLAYATNELSSASGRRVILALTNGDDKKSSRTWDAVTRLAQDSGVSIFGLNPDPAPTQVGGLPSGNGGQPLVGASRGTGTSALSLGQFFPTLCELTGGIMFRVSNAPDSLKLALQTVRERYILDFPRPDNATSGVHKLQVRVERGNDYFIRPAGNAFPAADPDLKKGPNIIPAASASGTQLAKAPAPGPVPNAVEQPRTASSEPIQTAASTATTSPPPSPIPGPHPMRGAAVPPLKVVTRLTLVDVTVTDKNNHPIRGLLQPDFTIKEDGKAQPIHNFAEYGTETSAPAPRSLPPGTFTNQPSVASGATNIILLDELSTGLRSHLRPIPQLFGIARTQAESYLKKMPPGTQVAVLDITSGIRVVQQLTSDRDLLIRAMDALRYKPVPGAAVLSDQMAPCDAANEQSRITVQALDELAAYLAGIEGRKTVIWFTPGTPWLTHYAHFSRIGCLDDYTWELKRSYGLLTAAQVALYPVDSEGVMLVTNSLDASISDEPVFGAMADASDDVIDQRNSLRAFADATGGIAYTDRNDLDAAAAEAIATGSDYYSLSYIPPRPQQDNLYHSIAVAVDRPAARLQYSSGYSDGDLPGLKPPAHGTGKYASPPDPGFHPGMLHGALNSTQLIFDLKLDSAGPRPAGTPLLGSPDRSQKNLTFNRYVFHYTLAPDQITFLDDPDGTRHALLEFDLIAYDAEGKALNTLRQEAKLTLHPGQTEGFLQQPFQTPIQFDVPTTATSIRSGIFDPGSQKSGTLEIPPPGR